ncbi:MAG: hypothetical protein HC831_22690 [Chloroflexia bacterium]|nr:hypothetical protein [Chloroflexia bacterium]
MLFVQLEGTKKSQNITPKAAFLCLTSSMQLIDKEKEEKRKKLEVTCEETYKRFNIKPLIVFWKDPYLQILRNTLQIIKPV